MLVLLIVALLIGAANVVAFLYGLTLPANWHAEADIVVDAPPNVVYPHIASIERWAEWSAWSKRQDPSIRMEYKSSTTDTGPSVVWMGEQVGQGRLTITETKPDESVRYTLVLQTQPFSENGRISLTPEGDGSRVTWTDGGEVEGTLGRFFRERLERSVADEFRSSLARLKATVEEEPDSHD
jgi:hypothetical protein